MIVAQITRLLAIGTSMSYVFVFTLLPAILSFDARLHRKLSIKKGKGDPDIGRFDLNPNYYNEDGSPITETVAVAEPAEVVESDESQAISEDAVPDISEIESVTADETVADVDNDNK